LRETAPSFVQGIYYRYGETGGGEGVFQIKSNKGVILGHEETPFGG